MTKRKPVAANRSSGSGNGRGRSLTVADLETVRQLARIATEFDLAEVEADASGGIRVSRRAEPRGGFALPMPAGTAAQPGSLSLIPSSEKTAEPGTLITSPFVGTFYLSPSPEAPPFVEVGQTVRKGQVVCIVEAMKLMNEIESEFDGKVAAILVNNAEHVEYGQPLFRLEKL